MDSTDIKTHLLKDVDPGLEGENNPFLGSPEDMFPAMSIVVQAEYPGPDLPVAEHSLRPIAERKDTNAFASRRNLGGIDVHLVVHHPARDHVAPDPGIRDSGPVDAEQDTQARVSGIVVDMGESIHPRLRVVGEFPAYSIHDSRSTCRRRYVTRIENVQGQGVVRLVTSPVGNRYPGLQAKLRGCRSGQPALFGERRTDLRKDTLVETEVIHQERSRTVLREIPEHPL